MMIIPMDRFVGEEWKKLSREEKDHYEQLAEKERERYHKEMLSYDDTTRSTEPSLPPPPPPDIKDLSESSSGGGDASNEPAVS